MKQKLTQDQPGLRHMMPPILDPGAMIVRFDEVS
jgi:hypothetical protein